ncbi:MAG: hypothetical protein ABIL77_04345 [candidate division WOR-3 bacterium]
MSKRKKPLPNIDPYNPTKYAIQRLVSEISSLTKVIQCNNCDQLNGMGAVIPDLRQILLNLSLHQTEDEIYRTIIHELLHILLPDLDELETETLAQTLSHHHPLIKKIKTSYLHIFLEFEKRR